MTDRTADQDDVDRTLVERFQRGDRSAFVDLMRRHERRVYNLAFRMLGRPEEARDATQDAFLACFRHLDRFRGDAAFTTWLHRIAVNACYDLLRKRPATTSLDDETADPVPAPDHADRAAAAADVQRALLAIPEEYRVVLVLFEVEDLSVEQISSVLGIPSGTVKSRLHRGRAALGRALGGTPSGGASGAARPAEEGEPRHSAPASNPGRHDRRPNTMSDHPTR
jgi:RNA polymerase sigma-70 factor, ECF subfamily